MCNIFVRRLIGFLALDAFLNVRMLLPLLNCCLFCYESENIFYVRFFYFALCRALPWVNDFNLPRCWIEWRAGAEARKLQWLIRFWLVQEGRGTLRKIRVDAETRRAKLGLIFTTRMTHSKSLHMKSKTINVLIASATNTQLIIIGRMIKVLMS